MHPLPTANTEVLQRSTSVYAQDERLQFWGQMVKIRRTSIAGLDGTPCPSGREMGRQPHPRGGCVWLPRVHYGQGDPLRTTRSRHQPPVPGRLLDEVLMAIPQRTGLLRRPPPMQGGKRSGGQDKAPLETHLTVVKTRSQRTLDSPCCAVVCLENQTKDALPTKWVSGTNPHIRESADRCRLSPIIQ